MSATPGLTHLPNNNESENTRALRAQGIVSTPMIELGSNVRLNKDGKSWAGFVLSIDRRSHQTDLIVNWLSKPVGAGASDNLGLFRLDQLSNVGGGLWEVDPSTVQVSG